MDNETVEVIEAEIVPSDEDNTNVAGNIAVLGLAAVGAVKVAQFAKSKVPFRIRFERTSKVDETPVIVTPTPVVE